MRDTGEANDSDGEGLSASVEISIMPVVGNGMHLPFTINIEASRLFSEALSLALTRLSAMETGFDWMEHQYDVSTGSANIPLEPAEITSTVSKVVKDRGHVFCITLGTLFNPKHSTVIRK
ncbi:hypothetical protein GF325_00880 [Candidatus Bathyarchaeota archaeon]|nr:hypothetical protein [Candidatus Bathyarchaeota archaeon]